MAMAIRHHEKRGTPSTHGAPVGGSLSGPAGPVPLGGPCRFLAESQELSLRVQVLAQPENYYI